MDGAECMRRPISYRPETHSRSASALDDGKSHLSLEARRVVRQINLGAVKFDDSGNEAQTQTGAVGRPGALEAIETPENMVSLSLGDSRYGIRDSHAIEARFGGQMD